MINIEDACNTHLGLGLGSQMTFESPRKKSCFKSSSTSFEPSLALSLPNESSQAMEDSVNFFQLQVSSVSDLSSFSDTAMKREMDQIGSEEVNKLCRRVISDEDEEGNTRKKLRLTKEQSALLEDSFRENNTLSPKQKLALAKKLNLRPRQVEVWFQNRRARTKLKQTETDCEYMKKYCEVLAFENKRLQKELVELKALKVAPQLYMHLPAAALTMCPSCERVTVSNERQFHNASNQSSAAS